MIDKDTQHLLEAMDLWPGTEPGDDAFSSVYVGKLLGRAAARIRALAAGRTRRLYLDLDGVMADFDAHFPATFGENHKEIPEARMWELIGTMPGFFGDLPLMPGALEFFREIEKHDPIILTACPKHDYVNVARLKRAWVRRHLSERATILPVLGGKKKALFMHAPGDILIDDFLPNILSWREEGGVGILHRSFDVTRAELAAILEAA